MPTYRDEENIEAIPAWKLAFEGRDLTPGEWERWYFARVVAYAIATGALAVVFVWSSTTGTKEPQSIFDVSGLMNQMLCVLSGATALWTVLMLTISVLGVIAARRAIRRGGAGDSDSTS